MLHDSQLLKKTCIRKVVLDKWFPLIKAPFRKSEAPRVRPRSSGPKPQDPSPSLLLAERRPGQRAQPAAPGCPGARVGVRRPRLARRARGSLRKMLLRLASSRRRASRDGTCEIRSRRFSPGGAGLPAANVTTPRPDAKIPRIPYFRRRAHRPKPQISLRTRTALTAF